MSYHKVINIVNWEALAILSYPWLIAIALLFVINHLVSQRDKYRLAWKREMETTSRIRKERAQLIIENTGLRAEVVRLKEAQAATKDLLSGSRIHLGE